MDKKQYRCSIIIPVFNGEQFIKKTIKSCLNQSIPVEIIIINDASTDESEKIISKFTNENISYSLNQENLGLMKTLNKAIKNANSDYLLILGHDDLLEYNHVENMLNKFDEKTSFVHCNANLIDENDEIFGVGTSDMKQFIKTIFIRKYLSENCFIHSTGAIISKEFFNEVNGYDETFKNYGEWLLWIKLTNIGKVKYCFNTRAKYRRHKTNITNTFDDKSVKKDLKVFFDFCKQTAITLFKNKV